MLAYLIDMIPLIIIYVLSAGIVGKYADNLIIDFYWIALQLTYFIFFEGLFGTSPGKIILHIKVIGKDGQMPPGFEKVLIRNIFKIINPLGLGFLAIVNDEEKRGWHDRIAKTYVVTD